MTPPADGESGDPEAAPALQASVEDAQASAHSNEASAVPDTPEFSPAESGDEEEASDELKALEDLILEAYNNMQIDGEYIFLPDEVAEKLHQVAEQVREVGENRAVKSECPSDVVAVRLLR
jgi:hypothetical protein